MPSYGRVARAGIYWSYFRQGLTALSAIPTAIILARLLSPHEFGVAAAAAFFVQLAGRLTRAGLNLALIRIKTFRPEHASSVFVFNMATSLVICAGLMAGAPWIGQFFGSGAVSGVLRLGSLNFVLTSLGAVPVALLRRDMRFKEVATGQSAYTLIEAATTVLLAYLGFSYWSLVLGMLAGNLAQSTISIYFARWRPSLAYSHAAFKELFSFGIGTYVSRLLEYAALNIDNLVVGRVLGITALGLYDKAFMLMDRIIGRINAAGPGVSFRIFAVIHDDPERFRRGYRKVVLTATLIGYPLFAWMLAVAPQLIFVLFGERWLAAARPFQLLCLTGMLKLLNEYVSSATQAIGWVWSEVWRQLLYLALIVAGVWALSPWGITGAAGGVLLATAIMFTLMQTMARRAARMRWSDLMQPQVPAIVCSLAIVALAIVIGVVINRSIEHARPWMLLLAQATAAGAFYLAFLRFSGFKDVRALVRETLSDFAPGLARTIRLSA